MKTKNLKITQKAGGESFVPFICCDFVCFLQDVFFVFSQLSFTQTATPKRLQVNYPLVTLLPSKDTLLFQCHPEDDACASRTLAATGHTGEKTKELHKAKQVRHRQPALKTRSSEGSLGR